MARKPDSLHVLPLFCDDLIASCVDMTPACFGAYMRLLCYAWTRGGIPDNEGSCARITGGMEPGDWDVIRPRLTVLDDGRLTHQRLELERVAVAEIREKRSEAGKKGGKAKANGLAKAKQTPSKNVAPNPSPSLLDNTHTASEPAEDFGHPGWAAEEWDRFLAVWNATARAAKWTPLMAPAGWVDLAASPGWLDRARQAMAKLPACRFFDDPLAVTKFFEFVDRILAGEFDNPKKQRGREAPDEKPPPQVWRDRYQAAPYRTPKEVAALAAATKLKEEDL